MIDPSPIILHKNSFSSLIRYFARERDYYLKWPAHSGCINDGSCFKNIFGSDLRFIGKLF